MPNFQEFFAGGGMVRAGLGSSWKCTFANDVSSIKADCYSENWGDTELSRKDVADVQLSELKDDTDLVWASFPCQDLSLAGRGAGLKGSNSGAFSFFWDLISKQAASGSAPKIIALENVMGAVTSHQGQDFEILCNSFHNLGYRFGAFCLDAIHFVPQSRKRLFIIGIAPGVNLPSHLTTGAPDPNLHSLTIRKFYKGSNSDWKRNWIWWHLPELPAKKSNLLELLEPQDSEDLLWHEEPKTAALLELMDEVNLQKVRAASLENDGPRVGTIYRRMRKENGSNIQRAEIRFDGVSGCLRVPAGGSSIQSLMFVEGNRIRSRNMEPRETARLMGLEDSFKLPQSRTHAYRVTGDGVVAPVVSYIRQHIFDPICTAIAPQGICACLSNESPESGSNALTALGDTSLCNSTLDSTPTS